MSVQLINHLPQDLIWEARLSIKDTNVAGGNIKLDIKPKNGTRIKILVATLSAGTVGGGRVSRFAWKDVTAITIATLNAATLTTGQSLSIPTAGGASGSNDNVIDTSQGNMIITGDDMLSTEFTAIAQDETFNILIRAMCELIPDLDFSRSTNAGDITLTTSYSRIR